MSKLAIKWIIVLGVVLITCATILNYHFSKVTIEFVDASGKATVSKQAEVEALEDANEIGEKEKERIIGKIQNSIKTEILDYTFGNKDSIVIAAVISRDFFTGAETHVGVLTDFGFGSISIAAGDDKYEYYRDNGIKLENSNTIALSLRNKENDEIEDFRIAVTRSGTNLHIELSQPSSIK